MRFGTKAIHGGQEEDAQTGAVTPPIYLTSTYSQRKQNAYVYGRSRNPTREALERNLATLEGGKYGLAFASGNAATTTVLTLLKKGDHVVSTDDLYGGTYRLFTKVFQNYGLEFDFVDATKLAAVEAAVRKETRMIWMESPTNPLLRIVDLKGIADIAQGEDILTVMDNTFASPYLQQPLADGFSVVMHSTTKYLGGHSDIIGGATVTSSETVQEKLRFSQNAVGAVPSPFDAWLTLRGIKTLHVRMERHCANAQRVAEFLEGHKKVKRVIYPGLESHPQHELARRQMRGFGGMVSFELKDAKGAQAFMKRLQYITLGESLGGVESLIEHPASMTHASIPPAQREAVGITDGLLRFSVGIEDIEDLLEDLEQALK